MFHDSDVVFGLIVARSPRTTPAWRQRDFDVLRSDRFRRLLRESGVKLVTWRELSASR